MSSATPRIYRIPIPEDKLIVCRKIMLVSAEWRAVARGIQHFDEESGRASIRDLFVIEAYPGTCRVEILLHDDKKNVTFWAPAFYGEDGEYAESLIKPSRVSVVLRGEGEPVTYWKPIELQVERIERKTPAPTIGRSDHTKKDKGEAAQEQRTKKVEKVKEVPQLTLWAA